MDMKKTLNIKLKWQGNNVEYEQINAYFFGNEHQKKEVYVYFILPYLSKNSLAPDYYVRRDWNGGPNYKITAKYGTINSEAFQLDFSEHIQSAYDLNNETIEHNLKKYQAFNETISGIEKQGYRKVKASKHGQVELSSYDEQYMKTVFNSRSHFFMQTNALCQLQPFVTKWAGELAEMPAEDRYMTVIKLMHAVLAYSGLDDVFSVLVYFSNSEGVLAVADQYGKRREMEEAFKQLYDRLPMNRVRETEPLLSGCLTMWKEAFDEINKQISTMINEKNIYEEGFYSRENQHQALMQNVAGLTSPFHQHFMQHDVKSVTETVMHQRFRFLVNIVYQCLHMLDVTFKEKAFFCYALSRFLMEEKGTGWQQIVKERSI